MLIASRWAELTAAAVLPGTVSQTCECLAPGELAGDTVNTVNSQETLALLLTDVCILWEMPRKLAHECSDDPRR